MLKALQTHLAPVATLRHCLILLLAHIAISAVLFNVGWIPELATVSNGAPLLDGVFGYTADSAYETLTDYTAEGRQIYQRYLLFMDFWYAVLFALVLCFFMTYLGKIFTRFGRWVPMLYAIPLLGFGLDVTENLSMLMALGAYPDPATSILGLAGIVTSLKLVIVNLAFLGILVGLIALAIYAVRRRRRTPA